MNDFIKKITDMGSVKDYTEAWIDNDPLEEDHKGNLNYYTEEESEVYCKYKKGDIVFVKQFAYNNSKKGTNHLFVIIEENSYCVPIEYFSLLLSSRLEKMKYKSNKLLYKDGINNLKHDSIVKTDVIYKFNEKEIEYKIGYIAEETINEYKEAYLIIYNKD